MKIPFSLLLLSCIILSCLTSNPKKIASNQVDNLSTKLIEIVGEDFQTSENEEGSYVLAWKETGEKNAKTIKFAVYKLDNKEIVYQGSALNGYVKWIDNSTIEKRSMPGIVNSENQSNTVQIDINKKTKKP
ncbi:MAG: hypothetical protein ABJH98_18980 [Reichenbachiella sp.]|uniref:hypothetical protein n=1 Tax=Reichenbachiella sp. TaxID=2184521 RepID=UPI003297B860